MELILFSWISFIKSILDDCGYSNVWQTHNCISHTWPFGGIKMRLTDQFKQNRHSSLQISPQALNYQSISIRMTQFATLLSYSEDIYQVHHKT
jgi:hypothetical protein